MINHQKTLSTILSGYFREESNAVKKVEILTENFDVPVRPSVCDWDVFGSPERFSRTFTMQSKTKVLEFVSEIIKYEMQTEHEGTLKIDSNEVTVEVYTHDLNRITELDQNYIKNIDFIYRDVLDFGKF